MAEWRVRRRTDRGATVRHLGGLPGGRARRGWRACRMISQMDRLGDPRLDALAQAERDVVAAQRAEVGCLALILFVAAAEVALLFMAFR